MPDAASRFVVAGLFLLGAGCATLPDKTALPPETVWAQYRQSSPAEVRAVYSATARMWFHSIALILYAEQTDSNLALAALSPTGIKVFEAVGSSNLVRKTVFIPQSKARLEAFAAASWKDLKFLLQPPSAAPPESWKNHRGKYVVEQALSGQAKVRYEFDAYSGRLRQKELYEKGRRICRIRLAREPDPIVIENHLMGYRLFLKTKR